MLGKTIVITCRGRENPFLRHGVRWPRNSTDTTQSLCHPWYKTRIYHGLELGVYIRGTTGDKSMYLYISFDNNRRQLR